MHRRVYREFERICAAQGAGGVVLEIGATPNQASLLDLPSIVGADERVGLNISGPFSCSGYEILRGNANCMDMFADESFDTVLCNAVLEHDKFFWKTLDEIRRVARPGALIVIGTPAYSEWKAARLFRKALKRLPGVSRFAHSLVSSTVTLNVHAAPGDYYRFAPQAFHEVFLQGLEDVGVCTVMVAPRAIGWGRKPAVVDG